MFFSNHSSYYHYRLSPFFTPSPIPGSLGGLEPQVDKGKTQAVEAVPPIAGPSQSKPSKAPGPRYVTQLPVLFTQQNTIEESIQEEEWQRDHKHLQAAHRGKNNIIVYAWIKVRVALLNATVVDDID